MPEQSSLRGLVSVNPEGLPLGKMIDLAFDYRGNVTIEKLDGSEVTGYVFNRNKSVIAPFLEYFDETGDGPYRLDYRDISGIRFTGRDTAFGASWEAWRSRKERASSDSIVKAG